MKHSSFFQLLGFGISAALLIGGAANADSILCKVVTNNHMLINDSQVSACLDAGTGNLTGNPANDLFLTGVGTGYVPLGKSDESNPFTPTFTQFDGIGTWGFAPSVWETYNTVALGFKFGTGNQPDEWFVYEVVNEVSSGDWTFVNVFGRGGGLSHTNLYGIEGGIIRPPEAVPEPATWILLGLGLIGLSALRRREPGAKTGTDLFSRSTPPPPV